MVVVIGVCCGGGISGGLWEGLIVIGVVGGGRGSLLW